MKAKTSITKKELLSEIDVYLYTMQDFEYDKQEPMYYESKIAIDCIIGLMCHYFDCNREVLTDYALIRFNSIRHDYAEESGEIIQDYENWDDVCKILVTIPNKENNNG